MSPPCIADLFTVKSGAIFGMYSLYSVKFSNLAFGAHLHGGLIACPMQVMFSQHGNTQVMCASLCRQSIEAYWDMWLHGHSSCVPILNGGVGDPHVILGPSSSVLAAVFPIDIPALGKDKSAQGTQSSPSIYFTPYSVSSPQ